MIDDFAPTGRHGDDGLESIAERLFRAVGNQQGRSRMVGNGRTGSNPVHLVLFFLRPGKGCHRDEASAPAC